MGSLCRRCLVQSQLSGQPRIAGLDSTNAAAVVGILAALGGRGVTVVLSIHQPRPDVLRLMDRTLILSGFGEVVYSGR